MALECSAAVYQPNSDMHGSGTLAALEDLARQLEEAAVETADAEPKQTAHLLQENDARIKRRKRYRHKS